MEDAVSYGVENSDVEEEFESCCEEDEEWQDPLSREIDDGDDDDDDDNETDEFLVRLFFKGISIVEDDESASKACGIGIVLEKSPGVTIIQVEKKLDFFVEEVVAEHLALLNGLIEAHRNGIRRVSAFTDSKEVYQQIAEVEPLQDQLLVALGYRILEHTNNLEAFSLKLAPKADLLRPLRLARKAVGIADDSFKECPICCEEKPSNDIIKLSCSHVVCPDCIVTHIEGKLQDMQVPIRCPQVQCRRYIPIKDCIHFLPVSVFESLERASVEAGVMNLDQMYCPFSNCSVLITPSHYPSFGSLGASSSSQSVNNDSLECPECQRLICTSCRLPWHSSMSCEEFENLPVEERDTGDITLHHLAQNNNWRHCQQCRRIIELTHGCYHMTCWCGHEFCYSCGLEYEDGVQTCQCEFWDDNNNDTNSEPSICSNQEAEQWRWEAFNPPNAVIEGYSEQERAQLALIQSFLAGGFGLGDEQFQYQNQCQSPPRCSDSYLDTIKDLHQLPWLERFVSVISDSYHDEYI